jgi:hypothetical protein
MKVKQTVTEYLQKEPLFRERKNKDRGMVNLLMNRYSGLKKAIESGLMTKEQITAMVQDYASMDRAWRQVLEQTPSLRGKDYDDKARLEEDKQPKVLWRHRDYTV